MSLCAECFQKGNHDGHDFNMFRYATIDNVIVIKVDDVTSDWNVGHRLAVRAIVAIRAS